MSAPQGMSRELGPLPGGPHQGQQGEPDLPPGFTYAQIESMVRELRTAAALEARSTSSPYEPEITNTCMLRSLFIGLLHWRQD